MQTLILSSKFDRTFSLKVCQVLTPLCACSRFAQGLQTVTNMQQSTTSYLSSRMTSKTTMALLRSVQTQCNQLSLACKFDKIAVQSIIKFMLVWQCCSAISYQVYVSLPVLQWTREEVINHSTALTTVTGLEVSRAGDLIHALGQHLQKYSFCLTEYSSYFPDPP